MQFKEGNIPLYFQFFLKIKNDILLGEIEPGSRVPTIEELHNLHGVSHATVRRALMLLEKEGLIIKRRGLGIIVRDEVDLPIWNPASILDTTGSLLRDLRPQVLSHGWVSPPHRIAKHFGVGTAIYRDGRIYKARRLWISPKDSRRKRVSEAYYAASLIAQIGEDNLTQTPFLEVRSRGRLYQSVVIKEILRPWICDADTAALLAIPDGTPVFHSTWVFTDSRNAVLAVTESISTANSLPRMLTEEKIQEET